jgi:hypothetical protein
MRLEKRSAMASRCPLVALALMIVPALASAQPVTLLVGPEIRFHLTAPYEAGDLGTSTGMDGAAEVGGLLATIAYPVTPHIALGIHGGLASRHYGTGETVGLGLVDRHDHRPIIADIAVTMQLTRGRLWAAPWLGRHVSRRATETERCMHNSVSGPWQCHDSRTVEWNDGYTSFGLTVGIDLVRIGAHNIAMFVDAQYGSGSYAAASTGIGYRLDFGAPLREQHWR